MLRPVLLSRAVVAPVWRQIILCLVVLTACAYVTALPRLPQDPAYHLFADSRSYPFLPNVANVITNAAFLMAGLAGLRRLTLLTESAAITGLRFLYLAVVCVGAGSAYYHWAPDNDSLFWDRLPMTLGFTSLTAWLLADRAGGPDAFSCRCLPPGRPA